MKTEDKKEGFFARLIGSRKAKKKSCCCNIEIEEIPEEEKRKDRTKKDIENDDSCM